MVLWCRENSLDLQTERSVRVALSLAYIMRFLKAIDSIMSWGRVLETGFSYSGQIHLYVSKPWFSQICRSVLWRCSGLNYRKCLLALPTVFSLCNSYLLHVFSLQHAKEAYYFFSSFYIETQLLHIGPYANIAVTELLGCQKYQRHVAYSLCFGYVCLPS